MIPSNALFSTGNEKQNEMKWGSFSQKKDSKCTEY